MPHCCQAEEQVQVCAFYGSMRIGPRRYCSYNLGVRATSGELGGAYLLLGSPLPRERNGGAGAAGERSFKDVSRT